LSPNDWRVHDLYGQPLAASNHYDMAIAEFKEAVSLDPKQSQVILELGAALEKKGDWLGALEQDKKAALTEASANGKHQLGEAFYFSTDAQKGYKAAQLRFADHVAALKAAGKSAQAADLEKRVQLINGSKGTLEKVQVAMQDGEQAFRKRRFADAEKSYTEAVKLA
jgi:tetratricopeptide (TPR) repeat protein